MPSHAALCRAHNAASPFLHGVQEGLFPRFIDTTRRSDSLPPLSPHFVSFAWRYHRCVQSSSPAAQDTRPWIILELVSRVSDRHFDGDGRVSQVPGEPS
jgi:hypothetical protein